MWFIKTVCIAAMPDNPLRAVINNQPLFQQFNIVFELSLARMWNKKQIAS
jgi:hypothetical protein